MNNLIDKAVKARKGLIGNANDKAEVVLFSDGAFYLVSTEYGKLAGSKGEGEIIGTIEEYKQRAKDLGFVNGFEWGKECPSNGKKPDLPGDLIVSIKPADGWTIIKQTSKLDDYIWDRIESFRIVDKRYKPKEAPMPEQLGNSEQLDNSWFERGELPPVGVKCEVYGALGQYNEWHKCEIFAVEFGRVFIKNDKGFTDRSITNIRFRPIKTERENFIDAAIKVVTPEDSKMISTNTASNLFGKLYDSGFRAPDSK